MADFASIKGCFGDCAGCQSFGLVICHYTFKCANSPAPVGEAMQTLVELR